MPIPGAAGGQQQAPTPAAAAQAGAQANNTQPAANQNAEQQPGAFVPPPFLGLPGFPGGFPPMPPNMPSKTTSDKCI